MFEMIEVEKVPESGRKPSPYLDQLKAFLASGMQRVRLTVPKDSESDVYRSLYAANKNLKDSPIKITKARDGIYLSRVG